MNHSATSPDPTLTSVPETPLVDTSGLAALERSTADQGTLDSAIAGGDALLGMAALGKTAAALALVVAVIFLCSYLVKRLHPQGRLHGQHLKVVGSAAVGNRERVVIVDVDGTWLVLGVGGGQVTKLHEREAPPDIPAAVSTTSPDAGNFANRFAQALKHQVFKNGAGQTFGQGKDTRGRS